MYRRTIIRSKKIAFEQNFLTAKQTQDLLYYVGMWGIKINAFSKILILLIIFQRLFMWENGSPTYIFFLRIESRRNVFVFARLVCRKELKCIFFMYHWYRSIDIQIRQSVEQFFAKGNRLLLCTLVRDSQANLFISTATFNGVVDQTKCEFCWRIFALWKPKTNISTPKKETIDRIKWHKNYTKTFE